MFPEPEDPAFGVFVKTQMGSVAAAGHHVRVEFFNGRRSRWAYVRSVQRLRKLAHTGEYDLVHAHYGLMGCAAAWQPLPVVVSFCGDDLLGTADGEGGHTPLSRVVVKLSHFAARRAHAIICKSEALRATLPSVDRARAHVLPNGVDTNRFCPGPRAEARTRLGISPDEWVVLFPHSPTQKVKRVDLAEAGVDWLRAQGERARLWRVSGVPHDALPDYYRAADCMLLTSDHEGSPNTVKEALCCDLPVVTVDAGDAKAWVALTPGSQVVDRDPEAIGRGIASVRSTGGRTDGRRVRELVGMEGVTRRLVNIYGEAMALAKGNRATH